MNCNSSLPRPAPAFDFYATIHKALRARMTDTLLAIGRMDIDDAADCDAALAGVQDLLAACAAHLAHENDFVHPLLEARAPGSSAAIAHDHEAHLAHIASLGALARSVQEAAPPARAAAARELYLQLSLFIADNFQHMHVEETAHNAALWAHYTDAELVERHDALLASIPPQEMMAWLRWLAPQTAPAERAALLADMRAKAPAPAFAAALELAQSFLGDADRRKLAVALESAAA